jgi:tetratricopeptide (TPR) repeat protein
VRRTNPSSRRARHAPLVVVFASVLSVCMQVSAKPKAKGADGPTAKQVEAFSQLDAEAKLFEAGAKDYEENLSSVVKHHFEERRRRVVSALDKRIKLEDEQVKLSRDEAIRSLEEFVAKYQGQNAHADATPDAMYRLAALYEERGRADLDVDLQLALQPAMGLYRKIIAEFPKYKEAAGVHYYLGHAYTDTGELAQAQQAWRSLVCANRFNVDTDPVQGKGILLQPLAQDHDENFWTTWYNTHPVPLDQLRSRPKPGSRLAKQEELEFVDPYEGCESLPQDIKEGDEPRYVAEVWWQLGNYHFDQIEQSGGPYELNRARAAYDRSMQFKKPPLYGVALYKRAWTMFKQQRYKPAVEGFVNLLFYADEQEEATGDSGADFRSEAFTYVASSLTYVDFNGPGEIDPYIARNDVLDVESDALAAEEKMAVAIERVQDPTLVPQDKKWSVEIYKALAKEFAEISQQRNAIRTLELTLSKFPLDRDAPKLQNQVADLYDALAKGSPDGSPVRDEMVSLGLAARTRLAEYVGKTDWTRANKDDPEALQTAEELVRVGLQRAAADHTNAGRALFARAKEVADKDTQLSLLRKAIDEYQMAAKGWGAYIDQDPNAIDAYESRFWQADALYWNAVLQLETGQIPSDDDIDRAQLAARQVRDSNEDDKFLQPAAFYLVVLADRVLAAKHREFEETQGASGVARREEVEFEGDGSTRRAVALELPREVKAVVSARDDYIKRVEPRNDPQKNGPLYAFQAADYMFLYGQFALAQPRFEAIMAVNCGKNEWGYKAWEKLISMSNFQGNAARSRELVEGKSCAFDAETKAAEDALRTPVRQGVAYLDARKLYDEAEGMEPGADRDKRWREAAAAYNVALDAAPDRDEAPEAAMNGAYAYKQVGEYDKAIAMYELFIARYGSEKNLGELKNGAPNAEPPVEANPERYENRVKYLKMAYDALGNAYVLFFDYPKAAQTFDTVSKVGHFTDEQRRGAAQQAMSLYASLGDAKGMKAAHDRFVSLGAEPAQVAEADFVLASATLKEWDQWSPDTGANATARKRAEGAMRTYYEQYRNNPAARKFTVEAAYWVAKMKVAARAGGEKPWWDNTIASFAAYRGEAPPADDGTSSAMGTREANFGAEAAFTLLDAEIKTAFDYDAGHHRFRGTPQDVLLAYQTDAKGAKVWFDRLQRIVEDYGSPEWGTAAFARQGSLYDSLRSGLYNARPPELVMFDAKTETMLKRAEESDNLQLQEKADAIRVQVETAWQESRDRELEGADKVMVDRYGRAIALARKYNVSNPAIVRAIQRLAFFTDVIGEAKLSAYTQGVPDLNYSPGTFVRIRPGLVAGPPPGPLPPLAPLSLEVQ